MPNENSIKRACAPSWPLILNRSKFHFVIFLLFNLFLFFHPMASKAQLRYGNEWINFNQKYYKIRLTEDGIYKITYPNLKQAGIPVDSLHPGRFQIFYMGKEQHIYIRGDSDSKFNPTDYILFHGKKNDGKPDEPMYLNSSEQHHQQFSLYTDSSFYFLTWTENSSDTNTLRMEYSFNNNYSLFPPERFLSMEVFHVFNEQYFDGVPVVVKNDIHQSLLTYGEGWLSKSILNNQSRSVILSVPEIGFYNNPVIAEVLIFGKSEVQNFSGNDHRLQINAGGQQLFDTFYKGFDHIKKTLTINRNLIDSIGGKINFDLISPQVTGVAVSQTALSYIRLNYEMKPVLNNKSVLFFRMNPGTLSTRHIVLDKYSSQKSAPVFFNLSKNMICPGSLFLDTVHVIIDATAFNEEILLCDTSDYFPVMLQEVKFKKFDSNNLNSISFLIITHSKLMQSAKKYETYRNMMGYKCLLTETQQLYDQFYYGLHHPIAIRHFIDFIWQSSASKPEYLLLLGKGLENDLVRNPLKPFPDSNDLVPAIGFPCSDGYFSSGIQLNQPDIKENQIIPALATGRIAAKNDSMVMVYLDKLIEYESVPDELWKKDLLHIGGEQEGIQDSLQVAKAIATDQPFGGNVFDIINNKKDPVVYDFKYDIQNRINEGLSLLTYFAHGSQNVLGIDMGKPSELKNKGKYPVMYMNGCNVGNPSSDHSLGEEYLFIPDCGAIAWLAHNTSTFIPNLGEQIIGYYNEVFSDTAELSYAMAVKNLISKADPFVLPDREFYRQWIFQGDPALKIYHPSKQDYLPDSSSISFNPEMIFTNTDSFSLHIEIKNKGRAAKAKFNISVDRTMPDLSIRKYSFFDQPAPYYSSAYHLKMETGGRKAQGINKFNIKVNYDSAIIESDFGNNNITTDYYFTGNGINMLLPSEFSIVSTDSINLIIQNRDLLNSDSISYIAEIDTTPLFNSPQYKKLPIIKSQQSVIQWKLSLPSTDSIVYYWRACIIGADSQKQFCEISSFIYIKNSPAGWSQSHFPQFIKNSYNNIVADSLSRTFTFAGFSRVLTVTASRWTHINRGIKLDYTLNLNPGVCADHNLVIMRFDGKTLEPAEINPRCNGDYDVNYRSFNMFLTQHQDSLTNYINSIPENDYVAVFTRYAVNFTNWQPTVYDAFDKIGGTALLRGIKNDFTAYALIGKKHQQGGITLAEDTVYEPVSPVPAINSKIVEQNTSITGMWYEGSIISPVIGPSNEWQKLYFKIEGADTGIADTFSLSVIGIDHNGNDTILKSGLNKQDSNLSFIDYKLYPNIRLKLEMKDLLNRTAVQLKSWQVTFKNVPEGTILNNNDFTYYADSLVEGDTFMMTIPFTNISSHSMNNLLVKYSFIHEGSIVYTRSQRLGILNPGQSVVYSDQIPTMGYSGQNKINIMFNPDNDQPEMYLNNNSLSVPFIVSSDQANPLLDVTFNGRHIMNGEIVSADPSIYIVSNDENPLLYQNDTSTFEIELKGPKDLSFRRIWFSAGKLFFYPAQNEKNKASVLYKPGLMADGVYTLRVQAYDKSGISAGYKPYQVDFKIVNKSSIGNVVIYPNPSSFVTYFSFTITGYTLPSEILIDIFSAEGKFVRQIKLTGENTFHIGPNNIPVYWDGTGDDGRVLQNGLYIYRMFVRQFAPGITPERAQLYLLTSGKIILLR